MDQSISAVAVSPQPAQRRHAAFTWVLTAALVLLLASSPAVTRLAVTQTLTVHDLVALRCGVGGLLLAPLLLSQLRAIPPRLLAAGLLLAFCQGWGMFFVTIVGLQFAPAAHASALGPGFVPVWVALWGWLFYRIRTTRQQRWGLLLITLGAAVLLWNSGAGFSTRMLAGDLLFLASSAGAGIYLTYVQRHKVPTLQGAALVGVYSALFYLPWFLFGPVESRLAQAPAAELAIQVLYQGVGAGALFIVMLNYVVLRIGGQRFSIIAASVPVLALLFGRWIAGDAIRLVECVAIALVSAGVLYGAFIKAKD